MKNYQLFTFWLFKSLYPALTKMSKNLLSPLKPSNRSNTPVKTSKKRFNHFTPNKENKRPAHFPTPQKVSGLQQHNETPTCAKQDLSKSSETSDVGKARIQLAFSQQSPTQHIDNNKSSTIIQNQHDKSSTMPYTEN